MIKLCRVDHRLLHGQVAFSWTNELSADCILIANDAVVHDEVFKTTMKLAKPSGVKLVIKNLEDSIKAINSGVTDKYRLLVVVKTIHDANVLSAGCPAVHSLNLGGTIRREGCRQISKAIFISDRDEAELKELQQRGVSVFINSTGACTASIRSASRNRAGQIYRNLIPETCMKMQKRRKSWYKHA